jgi:hypothetical protein
MGVEVSGDLAAVLSLDRQIVFAAARALTMTGQDAQQASIEAIKSTFTVRGTWYLPSNRFGIRLDPATVDRLEAVLSTMADWLIPHETGQDKVAEDGSLLAIPFVGSGLPRTTFSAKVDPTMKPRALGNQAVVLQTRSGPVLFYREGKGLVGFYNLKRRAHIRKQSTVVEPTVRTVEKRFGINFAEALASALKTAK